MQWSGRIWCCLIGWYRSWNFRNYRCLFYCILRNSSRLSASLFLLSIEGLISSKLVYFVVGYSCIGVDWFILRIRPISKAVRLFWSISFFYSIIDILFFLLGSRWVTRIRYDHRYWRKVWKRIHAKWFFTLAASYFSCLIIICRFLFWVQHFIHLNCWFYCSALRLFSLSGMNYLII